MSVSALPLRNPAATPPPERLPAGDTMKMRITIIAGSFVKSLIGLGASVLLCAALLVSSQPALAQFTQQGSKLIGTGAVGASFQGYSVAFSSDGNTAVVGGLGDNAHAGAAWVFI